MTEADFINELFKGVEKRLCEASRCLNNRELLCYSGGIFDAIICVIDVLDENATPAEEERK